MSGLSRCYQGFSTQVKRIVTICILLGEIVIIVTLRTTRKRLSESDLNTIKSFLLTSDDPSLPAPCLQVMKIHDETGQELNARARGRHCKAAESTFQDHQEQDINCKTCGHEKKFLRDTPAS